MEKDILGNDIDRDDLDAFETGDVVDDQTAPKEEPQGGANDYEDVVQQLESGKEIELDPEEPTTLSWKEKKANRWKQKQQEAEKERQAKQEAERRAELAERELQAFKQAYQRPQAAQPPREEPSSREEDELYDQQARLYELYNKKAESGNVTPEETAKFREEVRRLNTKIIETGARRVFQQQPAPDVGHQALLAQLQMQYPEIYNDPRASEYAQGLYKINIAEGAPASIETVKKCLNATAKRFKYAGASVDVDEGTKRRFSGTKRGSIGKTPATPKVPITKDILKIANAAYPQIPDEKERLKRWVEVHGKDYAEAMSKELS